MIVDNSIIFFSFNDISQSSWVVCACWKGELVLFNTSQTYVSGLHFVHYSSQILRINVLCPSFSHTHHLVLVFFFFVPDIFKKSRSIQETSYRAAKYSYNLQFCDILGCLCIYCCSWNFGCCFKSYKWDQSLWEYYRILLKICIDR